MHRWWGTAGLYTLLSSKRSSRALKVLNGNRFSCAQLGRNDQYISLICTPAAVIKITGFIEPIRIFHRGLKYASVLIVSNLPYTSRASFTENPYAPHIVMRLWQIRRSFAFSAAAGRLSPAAPGHGQALLFAR